MDLLRRTWQAWNEDKAQRLAAAIAYSTIFALAPLLIVATAIVGSVLGAGNGGHALDALIDSVRRSAGPAAASTVHDLVVAGFSKPRQGLVAHIIGWVSFVVAAGGLFAAVQDALNAVWRIEATKGGWFRMLRDRAAAFGMVLVVGFLLLVSLLANAAIAFVVTRFGSLLPASISPAAVSVIDNIVTLIVVAAVFALLFKVLPSVDLAWRDVWLGGIITAVLFVLGEVALGWYFAVAGVASAYGAAGSILLALLWIYYSALIMLFGAEFTKVYAHRARLSVPSTLRDATDQPAGIDPRYAGKT